VRLAVVGAGLIGRRHIAIIDEEPSVSLVAIVDPAIEAQAMANRLDVPRFTDTDAMLRDTVPDGVIIATPNALHAPVGIACASRGVHILVEKPLADTVTAAEALVASARGNGVHLLVGHHRRHNPIIRKAKEIVASGALGAIVAVSAQWLICKPDDYFNVPWRTQPGGGPVLINLIHDIDCLRYIVGEIVAVQAMISNVQRGLAVEDSAVLTLRFAHGALGTMTLSDTTPAPWSWETASGENPDYPHVADAHCYVIAGQYGSLAVPTLKLWRHAPNRNWFNPLHSTSVAVHHANPFVEQIRHFAAVIRGEETPRITGEDGARTLAVTLAVRDAAKSGKTVEP
jgi:predicted dehydrogenase